MTYREKLQKEHPEAISNQWKGGCYGCPFGHGYCNYEDTMCGKGIPGGYDEQKCTRCWDQIIPGTEEKKTKRLPPEEKEWKATVAVFKDGHKEKITYCDVKHEDLAQFATETGSYVYHASNESVTLFSNSKPTLNIKKPHAFYKIEVVDTCCNLVLKYVEIDIDHIEFEEVEVNG